MIPASLRFPADTRDSPSAAWSELSVELFGELAAALNAPTPPPAAALLAEFAKWNQFTPRAGPNVVDKTTVASWLDAYACALEKNAPSGPGYVAATARLLMDTGEKAEVPIVVAWQNGAVILKLALVSVPGGSGELWLHPSFAHRQTDLSAGTGKFTEALVGAWSHVRGALPAPAANDVFWRLLAADGHALPAMQLDGPSASAAALRGFWHLARGMKIDPDVYVLAEATSPHGRLEPVGHLRQKVDSIKSLHSTLSEYPPTLVAASALPADNLATLRAANSWAEVVQLGTVEELVTVRSCTANAVIAYLEHLAEKLDETPWTRDGKPVRLSDVHIPPQVWKDDYSFHPVDEQERDWRPADYDPASADREVAPRQKEQRRKVRVPWIEEFQRPQHQPIVIVAGPGFGKTSLLRWTGREIVLESLATLHARTKVWSEVRWPIISDLAAWLSKGGDSHDALRDAALDFAPLPKTHPKLQREALTQVVEIRLVTQTEHTHLFLDALDQVPAAQLRLLRERLGMLVSVTPRLVFSTREAALNTHLPFLSFSRLTVLEAAALSSKDARALAAKWLDTGIATPLELQLRAQPAMSVVADSPLLLTLACGIVTRSPNAAMPETTAYLYRDLMQSLARGEWRDAGTDSVHDPDALLTRLRLMAWRLFSREVGGNNFSRDTLIRALNGGSGSTDAQADAALNQLCHLGFLEDFGQSEGEPHYQFRHTSFLEFLAGSHLASETNAEGWNHTKVSHWHSESGWQAIKISELLDAHAFEPAWEPLFAFIGGLLKQPKSLLEMLADRSKDDIYRYRLRLLCICYGSLAAEKEKGVEELMDRVFPIIERRGRIAKRQFPDWRQWKEWLATVGHLLNLPNAGSRVAKFLACEKDPGQGLPELREEALRALSSITTAPNGDEACRILALRTLLKAVHTHNFCLGSGWVKVRPSNHRYCLDEALIAQERHDTALFEFLMPGELRRVMSGIHTYYETPKCWGTEPPSLSESAFVAKLIFGTAEWAQLEQKAFARLRGTSREHKDAFSVALVCFGAKSWSLIALAEEWLAVRKWNFWNAHPRFQRKWRVRPWIPLMRELARRGWRFQISRRKFVVLRRGQNAPRAGAEFFEY